MITRLRSDIYRIKWSMIPTAIQSRLIAYLWYLKLHPPHPPPPPPPPRICVSVFLGDMVLN